MALMEPKLSANQYDVFLRRVKDIPSLPDVVNRIVETLGQPEASASEVARLISYDPGLTSKFLRMVNSAAYGFQRQISSVQHAIMILGFGTVRGVVLSASLFRMFESKGVRGMDPNRFWQHSIGTAIASRVIANHHKIRYAEDAFSAGMLHDIGKMIFQCYFPIDYAFVLQESAHLRYPLHGNGFREIEERFLKADHAMLGYQLAQRWKIPTTISEAIRYHHEPENAVDAQELVYTVALANAFCTHIQDNFGVLDVASIPQSVLDYFHFDIENPKPFEDLFRMVCDEISGVEELLSTLKT